MLTTNAEEYYRPSRFDYSVSHHLCYSLYSSLISLVQLFAPIAVKIFFFVILLYNFSHEPAK